MNSRDEHQESNDGKDTINLPSKKGKDSNNQPRNTGEESIISPIPMLMSRDEDQEPTTSDTPELDKVLETKDSNDENR